MDTGIASFWILKCSSQRSLGHSDVERRWSRRVIKQNVLPLLPSEKVPLIVLKSLMPHLQRKIYHGENFSHIDLMMMWWMSWLGCHGICCMVSTMVIKFTCCFYDWWCLFSIPIDKYYFQMTIHLFWLPHKPFTILQFASLSNFWLCSIVPTLF